MHKLVLDSGKMMSCGIERRKMRLSIRKGLPHLSEVLLQRHQQARQACPQYITQITIILI
jgi:hypothetical protein